MTLRRLVRCAGLGLKALQSHRGMFSGYFHSSSSLPARLAGKRAFFHPI
jgi:hypothetical protein